MNYYGPRELHDDGEPTGTYHYTRRNDSRVWPLGYCAGTPETTHEEWDERMGANAPDTWDEDETERPVHLKDAKRGLRVNREIVEMVGEKFHDHGHDTEEEAIECYTEYCLDVKLATYEDESTEWRRYHGVRSSNLSEPVEGNDVPPDVQGQECRHPDCETIVAYATATINAGGSTGHDLYLCSDHCNRESIEEWWSAPGSSISSF